MNRREFFTFAGGAAAWPAGARAQAALPVVGWLGSGSEKTTRPFVEAFWRGMGERGFVEGRNARAEYRWAEDRSERLPELAADLVRQRVDVIVAANGFPAAFAAKDATKTLPVVFLIGTDPVAAGLVASLNRPGGNLTGVTAIAGEIAPKRLSQLLELAPVETVAVLLNSANPANVLNYTRPKGEFQVSAKRLGVTVELFDASKPAEIGPAVAKIASRNIRALFVAPDTLFTNNRDELAELALKHRIAASAELSEFTAAGGLASYGTDRGESRRLAGRYVARILSGERPADLPVVQAQRFQLTINLKTARALGLTVPTALLATADEVIE